jgi:mRNA interferase YafQ
LTKHIQFNIIVAGDETMKIANYSMQKLDNTIVLFSSGGKLPVHYLNHPLRGNFNAHRECHVGGLPDWLLVYKKDKKS